MRYSIVEIKGGFGNQLFQYNFANYLKLQNHKVSINNYWFKSEQDKYDRSEIFVPKFYGFKKASSAKLKYIEINDKLFPKERIKYQFISDLNFSDTKPSNINYYSGYWQNIQFLDEAKHFLKNVFSKDKNFNTSLKNKYKDSVMIHIRSKNYGTEVLESNYYEQAIKLLNKKSKHFEFNLFTDDESVINKLPFKNHLNSINIQNEYEDDTILTFYEMIRHENFIISNSTYSFMAALLGSDKKSNVYQPSPWMKEKNKNLIVKDWRTINRIF